jgi:flagellar secretion chaperone FliS
MAGNTSDQYLEGKILTASQPRLHLALLEGALRHCRTARQAAVNENWGDFAAALAKAMDLVEELVNSVCRQKTEISAKLEEQYAFIFRELAACRFSMDLEKLESCAKLLDFERETWKLACEKLEEQSVARPVIAAPHLRTDAALAGEGLSLEA